MGCAVNLYDQLFGAAYKVNDIRVDGFLSGEFKVVELPFT